MRRIESALSIWSVIGVMLLATPYASSAAGAATTADYTWPAFPQSINTPTFTYQGVVLSGSDNISGGGWFFGLGVEGGWDDGAVDNGPSGQGPFEFVRIAFESGAATNVSYIAGDILGSDPTHYLEVFAPDGSLLLAPTRSAYLTDVSALVGGQTIGSLVLSMFPDPVETSAFGTIWVGHGFGLRRVSYEPIAVTEPSTSLLFGLGVLAIITRCLTRGLRGQRAIAP